jgi:hypothetical protein
MFHVRQEPGHNDAPGGTKRTAENSQTVAQQTTVDVPLLAAVVKR